MLADHRLCQIFGHTIHAGNCPRVDNFILIMLAGVFGINIDGGKKDEFIMGKVQQLSHETEILFERIKKFLIALRTPRVPGTMDD